MKTGRFCLMSPIDLTTSSVPSFTLCFLCDLECATRSLCISVPICKMGIIVVICVGGVLLGSGKWAGTHTGSCTLASNFVVDHVRWGGFEEPTWNLFVLSHSERECA